MTSGSTTESVDSAARCRKIVLAGNPNVGKSALFNALTGLSADVSNYPGTTIDIAHGMLGTDSLSDTPGVYGVSSFNDEEKIARKMILEADIVVNVVSAFSLDRDLFLTLQLIDMGKSVLLVINQWDEALDRAIKIDTHALAEASGLPVLTAVAVRKQGIEQIRQSIEQARRGKQCPVVQALIAELLESGMSQQQALLCAEGDRDSYPENFEPENRRTEIYRLRRRRVNELVELAVDQSLGGRKFSNRLGRWLLHPLFGGVTAMLVCYLLFYQMLGVFVARQVVDVTEKKIMRQYYEPFVRNLSATFFPCTIEAGGTVFAFPAGTAFDSEKRLALQRLSNRLSPEEITYNFRAMPGVAAMIGYLLSGEYGILTLTVTYLLGLLMPLVIAFYLGLSLMEDSGYLPRLAVLVDRLLNKAGLTGRAVIPLILGLGCVTMATVTTRLLSSNREKIIATALLGIAIPCSAQLGIVSGTLARAGGAWPWTIYAVIVLSILILTGLILNRVLPGKSGALIIDLPPMRLPRAENVLKKTWTKSYNFLIESIPMFCLAGIAVSIAQLTGLLDLTVRALQPLTVGLLHLPDDERIPVTFILGIVRRDFAAFGLTDVPLTAAQAVVAMVVITLFVPCIATVGVMIKERGVLIAVAIWLGSWIFAFAIGAALSAWLPLLLR